MNAVQHGRVAVALSLLLPAIALAQATPKKPVAKPPAPHIVPAGEVAFQPLEVPGFPTGTKLAPIHGDPNAATGTYVIRLSFPDGYRFPAHYPPNAENLTVLEGELLVGMGSKAEGGTTTGYKAGSFMYIPPKMAHFGGAKGVTVVQLHGQAPFKIILSAPAKQ